MQQIHFVAFTDCNSASQFYCKLRFRKDVSDIEKSLERRLYRTRRGGVISVPADAEDMIEIRPEDILVRDAVSKVK
jgi:hypothetical protein